MHTYIRIYRVSINSVANLCIFGTEYEKMKKNVLHYFEGLSFLATNFPPQAPRGGQVRFSLKISKGKEA